MRWLACLALMMSQSVSAIGIAWDAVDDARVHHYEVYYSESPQQGRTFGTTTELEFDLPDHASGRYWVGVRACDEFNLKCSDWARGTFKKNELVDTRLFKVEPVHSKYRLPAGD